ncbi:hypothetical protein LB505_008107 [Fusarium chuoi]|nr:hypothetical protein LB505_008107 [Fusarium chuoi]
MSPPFQISTELARSPRTSKTRSLRSATPASLTTTMETCPSFGTTLGLSSGLMRISSLRRITPTGRRTFIAIYWQGWTLLPLPIDVELPYFYEGTQPTVRQQDHSVPCDRL